MDNNTLSSTSKELENDDPLLDTVDSSPSCNSSCIVSHNPTTQTSTSVGSVSPTTQTSTSCGSLNPATQTLTSSGSVNPTTSTPTRCGSLNQNVDNLSCEGKESLSIEISITNTKNVSNEVNENKDVKIKMTDSTDVPCKLNDKKTEPFKEEKDEKAKKRKSSAETLDVSAKKVKSDTQKSARTHVIDKPKSDYSSSTGTPCVKCCQHTCPQQSRKYWNNKEDGGVQTVQLMEGSPFVVPHGHIGPCHACAAAQGGNLLSTSHSYTLSGIGSLSQMMPYHQAYGGGYPVPFAPSSSTPLPHCGCPSCYPPTTGVYYPQTSTPITHQPLQHEPCMVPPHPVHIANEETEIIDVVGGESDDEDKDSSLENLSPPIKFEKTKKKTSSSLDLIRKKKKKIIVVKKNAKEKFTKTKEQKKVKKKIIKDKKKLKKNVKPKIVKKPQYRKTVPKHGWEFEGHPETRKIMCHSVGSMVERSCYPCIRHIDGDVIHVRDCVLLRSGPRKSDIPYVAKVKAFWEDPISKEMMMSILWYYQPEHIEGGRKPHHLLCELFASKHKDENCVACIEDKGYVLTYAEYCRLFIECPKYYIQENTSNRKP
ncbi:hypothetical protein KUTeg_013842 [Tegillarca granosa]|uniref:BAH domain-containing protein n=1 Tax=Tegillarca granosa TaxID=220873 RepID=A0ABQ9F0A1_TEGGR|nr:hypothetical protein KUTeg_013842 [Tegillarca granosa]